MAEVKVQVRADTKSAEDALRRAQQLADSLGKKQQTIKIKAEGLDGLAKQIKVVENETAKLSMSADTFKALSSGAITAKQAMEDMGAKVNRVNTDMQSFIDHATGVSRETSQITAKTSMFGKVSDDTFKSYTSGAMSGADATQTLRKGMSGLGNETQKTSGIFDSLTKRFTAANLISAAVTRGITLLRTALRQAVTEMKEMDKELTTIKMVTGASDMDISALRQQAFAGARDTGRTTSDYLSAAERFARAGYRENIQDLTKLSLVTQNVGGVTEDVASKFILAADAAWKMGGNTERLWSMLDGVTSIADQNATDIGKIAEAYTVAGSAFANAGESERTFAALIGTTTAATQRSGSEMARGLQTILFRVRQVKGELDDGEIINASDISNAAKALDSVGISVLNDSKELKSFTEIMGELNKKWDTLNTKQKAYLQNALAGNRRGNVLFSLMDNYDVYQRQLEQFDEASGTALEKNAIFTDSWQAATNELNTSWTETISLLTDAGGLLQGIVKLTTNVLDFINRYQTWSHEGRAKGYFDRSEDWRTTTARNLLSPGVEGFSGGGGGRSFADDAWKATDAQNALVDATIQVIKVYADETEAVDQLSTAFEKSTNKIKAAAEAMKSEKDDSIKSAADIYKAMKEAEEKGYYGSNAYKQGAELLFGTSDRQSISSIAQKSLDAYFDAISKGDYSNAAAALWGNFADASGDIVDESSGKVIASMTDLGDSYQWAFNKGQQSMDDFLTSMQTNTGIGKDFWASMIQSLGMYSDEMDDWMAENTEMPEPELKVKTDSAQSEVQTAVDNINSMLDGIQDKTVRINIIQTIDGMSVSGAGKYVSAAIAADAANERGKSMTAYYQSKGYGRAGGKHDGYSGIALVNDQFPADGSTPELIISKSMGGAYIANGGRPALVNLRSDDVVLTASETKSAFGVPGFAMGLNTDTFGGGSKSTGTIGSLFGKTISDAVQTVVTKTKDKIASYQNGVTTTSPKNPNAGTSGGGGGGGGGGGSSAVATDPNDTWSTLKKLVDYLLEKGNEDLKEQLKVLDDQLDELEAERKAQENANKLQERQLAVSNALLDLNKAQVERTVRYYNEETQQWEWMADQKAVQDAQEAYDKALKDLNDYLADQDYEERKAAIQAQKEDLQAQFDAYKDSWSAIVDAIEAPSGDIKALLAELKTNGTSTMVGQSGGIAALLNALRGGLVGSGYQFGLSNINANTSGSTTRSNTKFDSGGIAFGSGLMQKGAVGPEAVIGPDITSAILNPVRNSNFAAFADSVRTLMGASDAIAYGRDSFVTNNNGGNIYVNGMKIGSDMMQKPFVEVMQALSIHVNEAV